MVMAKRMEVLPRRGCRDGKATSKGGVMEVYEIGNKEKEKRNLARKEAVDNLDVAGKGPNTGKDEETVRERYIGIGKRSSQKKRKSQLMESENDAGIKKEAKGMKRNKHDPRWLEEECRMCHQCQKSDKDRIFGVKVVRESDFARLGLRIGIQQQKRKILPKLAHFVMGTATARHAYV